VLVIHRLNYLYFNQIEYGTKKHISLSDPLTVDVLLSQLARGSFEHDPIATPVHSVAQLVLLPL